jgi:hypothetical protein
LQEKKFSSVLAFIFHFETTEDFENMNNPDTHAVNNFFVQGDTDDSDVASTPMTSSPGTSAVALKKKQKTSSTSSTSSPDDTSTKATKKRKRPEAKDNDKPKKDKSKEKSKNSKEKSKNSKEKSKKKLKQKKKSKLKNVEQGTTQQSSSVLEAQSTPAASLAPSSAIKTEDDDKGNASKMEEEDTPPTPGTPPTPSSPVMEQDSTSSLPVQQNDESECIEDPPRQSVLGQLKQELHNRLGHVLNELLTSRVTGEHGTADALMNSVIARHPFITLLHENLTSEELGCVPVWSLRHAVLAYVGDDPLRKANSDCLLMAFLSPYINKRFAVPVHVDSVNYSLISSTKQDGLDFVKEVLQPCLVLLEKYIQALNESSPALNLTCKLSNGSVDASVFVTARVSKFSFPMRGDPELEGANAVVQFELPAWNAVRRFYKENQSFNLVAIEPYHMEVLNLFYGFLKLVSLNRLNFSEGGMRHEDDVSGVWESVFKTFQADSGYNDIADNLAFLASYCTYFLEAVSLFLTNGVELGGDDLGNHPVCNFD